jgi:hypothetical protein
VLHEGKPPRRVDNVDTVIFHRGSLGCHQASPRCVDQHLVVRRLIDIHNRVSQRHIYRNCGSSMTRSTRVALRDPHGVSTIVTEPPNYDGPHVPVIVIMTSDSCTYVPHNLKACFPPNRIKSQEYCNIITVYSKYHQSKVAEVLQ